MEGTTKVPEGLLRLIDPLCPERTFLILQQFRRAAVGMFERRSVSVIARNSNCGFR